MRRNRIKSCSTTNIEEKKEEIQREVEIINEQVDFDDPKQIDFDLLVVSNLILTNCVVTERVDSVEGLRSTIQQALL